MKNSKYPGKTAIEEYFIERPNIARIFDELNFSLIKGDTVEKYLNQANLMRDSDTRRIVSQGFSDISVFLEELESDVNILIRKDKAISEEFKNKHGEEMPEGLIGTFILYPEIKEALREAKELLNKDDGTGSQVEQLYRRLFSISESWNSILTTRASWRTMSIENLNFSYWDMAISHTEEYLLKYEEDRMDVEGITYRIDTLNLFISEYEKYFESCLKSNTEISKDVNNKFFAVVESLIGAELTLVKMVEAGENYDTNLLYNRKDRPNSETINDAKISAKNTDFEDIMEYTFHKGCIYNGWWNEVNENNVLLIETPFRFGLKHGIEKRFHENGTLKMEILYFNDKSVEILSEFDEDGKILTSKDKISEIEEEKNPNIDNSKEEGSKVSESFKNNLIKKGDSDIMLNLVELWDELMLKAQPLSIYGYENVFTPCWLYNIGKLVDSINESHFTYYKISNKIDLATKIINDKSTNTEDKPMYLTMSSNGIKLTKSNKLILPQNGGAKAISWQDVDGFYNRYNERISIEKKIIDFYKNPNNWYYLKTYFPTFESTSLSIQTEIPINLLTFYGINDELPNPPRYMQADFLFDIMNSFPVKGEISKEDCRENYFPKKKFSGGGRTKVIGDLQIQRAVFFHWARRCVIETQKDDLINRLLSINPELKKEISKNEYKLEDWGKSRVDHEKSFYSYPTFIGNKIKKFFGK